MSTDTRSDRRRALLLLLALAGLLVAFLAPLDVSADEPEPQAVELPPRSVVVDKVAGLTRGEIVTVTWEGYEPNGRVYIHQCKKATTTWFECAEISRVEAVSDDTGAGTVEFAVWGGTLPRVSGVFGQGNNQITCNGGQCDIVVSECPFDVKATRTVQTNIGLTPAGTNPTTSTTSTTSTTTSTLPVVDPGDRTTLSGAGSAELRDLIVDWQGGVLNDPYWVDWEYTLTNSPSGNNSFAAGLNDFVISGLPLDETQLALLESRGQGVAYVPVAVGMLTVATKWELNGIPLRELNLSASTLAKTYQGDLTLFFEEDFTTDNGGCSFPVSGRGPRVGFRTDQSSSNYWFSHYLDENSSGVWELGSSPIIPIESSLVTGRTGAYNLALWIASGGTGNYNEAPVGFFDYSWSRFFDLMPIHIQNGAGEWVVPTREGAKLALDDATVDEDGTVSVDPASDAPGIYPMTIVYYATVPTELTTTFPEEEADALAETLKFVTSEDGQDLAAARGFVPLTDDLQALAADAIKQIPGQAPTTTTTTTTSTTSTTTTTLPVTLPPTTFVPATFPPATDPLPIFDPGPPIVSDSGSSGSGSTYDGGTSYVDPGTETVEDTDGSEEDDGSDEVASAPTTEPEDKTVLARALGDPTASPALPALLVLGLIALAVGPVMRFFGQRSGL